MPKPDERTSIKLANLKKGDYFSIVQYYQFEGVEQEGIKVGAIATNVMNDQRTYVGQEIVEKCVDSAAYYTEEERVNRTKLAELLEQAKDAVFTVKFTKKEGEQRVMIGHLLQIEPKMGRSYVFDLENKGTRLVDHRTLDWLIIKGKKYYV